MENASKALIIAGAILLSILLISLGILIFNQANDIVSGSGMSQAEISSFNAKFTQYEGTKRGSVIRSMVQEVMANNNSENASSATQVKITSGEGDAKVVTLDAAENSTPSYGDKFKNTLTYNVECVYTNGRVTEIKVTK